MALKSVSPKVVAQVAFGLARFFSVQSIRFQKMLPESTETVTDIACKRFASKTPETLLFYNLTDTTARLIGIRGFEVTISDPTSRTGVRKSLSPEVCLIFTYEGKFVLVEKKNGRCRLTVSDEKKLTALVKRFPELTSNSRHFFPVIHYSMSELAFVHREMAKFKSTRVWRTGSLRRASLTSLEAADDIGGFSFVGHRSLFTSIHTYSDLIRSYQITVCTMDSDDI